MSEKLDQGNLLTQVDNIGKEEKLELANKAIDATSAYVIKELKDLIRRSFSKRK